MRTIYTVLAGGIGMVLVAALLVFAGFRAGQRDVQSEWDAARASTADALALLAQRYAAADAEAERLRASAKAVAQKRVNRNVVEVQALPDRGCGWSPDEQRLLHDSYCASFPAAPECVSSVVRDAPGAELGRAGPAQ